MSTSSDGTEAGGSGAPEPLPVGAPSSALALLKNRFLEAFSEPANVLALVLIAALAARTIWLTLPEHSLIFDESYYVNAARVLLGWHVPDGAAYAGSPAGLDPNTEHPPLGKLLMALSMAVFGDNGLGWRLPSVIAGMVALVTLYLIVRLAGESPWLGILAVGFFGFDNLALIHSRIGTLDMMVLALILVGAWLALRGNWAAAGVVTAVGTLVKLTAVYGLLALVILQALALLGTWRRERRIRWPHLRPTVLMLGAYALVAVGGLWLLDARFTSYPGPIDHIRHMVEYGASLTKSPGPPGSGAAIDSAPWQWLFNEGQINYLRTEVTVKAGDKIISSHASIDFRGALNPLLAGAIVLASLFALWLAWRKGSRLALWAAVWTVANYLPYVALVLIERRITYIYYFLPVVPALAVAVALFLRRSGLPRFVMWGYIAAYLVGFAAYFPFRQIP